MAAPGERHRTLRVFVLLLPCMTAGAVVALISALRIYDSWSSQFVMAALAASLHFAFGVYFFFTQDRIPHLQRFITPACLLAAFALWCGAVADFASSIVAQSQPQPQPGGTGTDDAGHRTDPALLPWSQAGCALSVVNVLLDLGLLGLFGLNLVRHPPPSHPRPPGAYGISAPVYAVPPIAAQFQKHFPAPVPPELMGAERGTPAPAMAMTPMTPTTAAPSYRSRDVGGSSSGASPPPGTGTGTGKPSPGRQTPWYPYDWRNRIDVIRRLCSLQHPDGHWERSEELAELVRAWSAADAVSPLESSGRDWKAGVRAETARAYACLRGLCETVWVARLQGTETAVLSVAERISLQAVGYDLGWAKNALERAADWQATMQCRGASTGD